MLRKLMMLLCLGLTTNAIAQNTRSTPTKTTEKPVIIDYKQMGAPMPALDFIPFYDSAIRVKHRKEYMSDKDFNNGANLFVMMFNPTCSHCQDQTKLMEKNIDLFSKSKFILLANNVMKPYLPDFYKTMKLVDYPQFYLGSDSTDFIGNVFLYQSLPQINVYDKDRKLIRTYTGEVPIDTLKQFIQ